MDKRCVKLNLHTEDLDEPMDDFAATSVTFGYLLVINLAAYSAFYVDKKLAQNQKRRIPESTLLLLALIGGTVGAITAQHQFRHKTRKQPFKSQLYFIALLHTLTLVLFLLPNQRAALIGWIQAFIR